jgi:hypothetical protein
VFFVFYQLQIQASNEIGGESSAKAKKQKRRALVNYAQELAQIYYTSEYLHYRMIKATVSTDVLNTLDLFPALGSSFKGKSRVSVGISTIGDARVNHDTTSPLSNEDPSPATRQQCETLGKLALNAYYLVGAHYLQEQKLGLAVQYLRISVGIYSATMTRAEVGVSVANASRDKIKDRVDTKFKVLDAVKNAYSLHGVNSTNSSFVKKYFSNENLIMFKDKVPQVHDPLFWSSVVLKPESCLSLHW